MDSCSEPTRRRPVSPSPDAERDPDDANTCATHAISENIDTRPADASSVSINSRRRNNNHPEQRKSNNSRPRRSTRGTNAIRELASLIAQPDKKVVFIIGAGISVASGVRPFRSFHQVQTSDPQKSGVLPTAGLWDNVIWSTATREAFRKNPLAWYNQFWIPHFMTHQTRTGHPPKPNPSHFALHDILLEFPNVTQITQNIDGLQPRHKERFYEAHGRLGQYKCIPNEDSDTESDSDDEPERTVQLGHRRKQRLMTTKPLRHTRQQQRKCPYQYEESLMAQQLEPRAARQSLMDLEHPNSRQENATQLTTAPRCLHCGNTVLPQALLFDEGYHSHSYYQFEQMEKALEQADVLVFCGTSCSVHLTAVALQVARTRRLPVYNFNLHDTLTSTMWLNVNNIMGPAQETLVELRNALDQAVIHEGEKDASQGSGQKEAVDKSPRKRRAQRQCVQERVRTERKRRLFEKICCGL